MDFEYRTNRFPSPKLKDYSYDLNLLSDLVVEDLDKLEESI